MKFTILTLFPEIILPFFETSIMKRAVQEGLITYELVNFRTFATDNYHTVDDKPYGGGAGQLLKCDTMAAALDAYGGKQKKVIYAAPSGVPFSQKKAEDLSKLQEIVFICGRYEGLDERIIDCYNCETVSVGDYVLSSGEVATLTMIDAIYRLCPGVIDDDSLDEESFNNFLLEYPQYTKPAKWQDLLVPAVLTSGNHEKIRKWKLYKSVWRTCLIRDDLINKGLALGVFDKETKSFIQKVRKTKAYSKSKVKEAGLLNGMDDGVDNIGI